MLFQYITCYSLSRLTRQSLEYKIVSIHHMLLFINNWIGFGRSTELRFNTSHVTLYLSEFANMTAEEMFQYITCYSLSRQKF